MPVNLSIKEVPDALAARLRSRARRNNRSLQRELMTIIEAAAAEPVTTMLTANAPAAPAYGVAPLPSAAQAAGGTDDLLDELDAIVAHSQWGHADLLSRDQAHDRRLQRELDYEARRVEAAGRTSSAS